MARVHILPWLSNPLRRIQSGPVQPLSITVGSWQREPGEDWSADIAIRYHGQPELSTELCLGRERINGEVGYVTVATVCCLGDHIGQQRSMFPTLHSAMLGAEGTAVQLVRDQHNGFAREC